MFQQLLLTIAVQLCTGLAEPEILYQDFINEEYLKIVIDCNNGIIIKPAIITVINYKLVPIKVRYTGSTSSFMVNYKQEHNYD